MVKLDKTTKKLKTIEKPDSINSFYASIHVMNRWFCWQNTTSSSMCGKWFLGDLLEKLFTPLLILFVVLFERGVSKILDCCAKCTSEINSFCCLFKKFLNEIWCDIKRSPPVKSLVKAIVDAVFKDFQV